MKVYITHKKGDANGEGFSFLISAIIPALVCEVPFDWAPNGYTGKTSRAVLAVDADDIFDTSNPAIVFSPNLGQKPLEWLCGWLHSEDRDDARRLLEVHTTIPDDTDDND